MERRIVLPTTKDELAGLKAGDMVYISGTIYTARDAAHKRMWEALKAGEDLPIDVKDNVIYYMGFGYHITLIITLNSKRTLILITFYVVI